MSKIFLIANSDDIFIIEEVTFCENLLKYISEIKTLIPEHEFKFQLLLILEQRTNASNLQGGEGQLYIELGF